jgi:tRNA (cytidine/uridine-2'-O-)-methyltransferase
MKSKNLDTKVNIVLLEPEIPQNTGNIARTCVALGASLHLIRPLGFALTEKAIRRSGMDYWERLDLHLYDSYTDFLIAHPHTSKLTFVTTKSKTNYADYTYHQDTYLIFGKESAGLPEEILVEYEAQCVRIPMLSSERSLNLSNAVAIVGYEVLRHNDFLGLEQKGKLHRLQWKSDQGEKE